MLFEESCPGESFLCSRRRHEPTPLLGRLEFRGKSGRARQGYPGLRAADPIPRHWESYARVLDLQGRIVAEQAGTEGRDSQGRAPGGWALPCCGVPSSRDLTSGVVTFNSSTMSS